MLNNNVYLLCIVCCIVYLRQLLVGDCLHKIKGVHGYLLHVNFEGSRDEVVWPYFYFLVFFDKFCHQIFIGASEKNTETVVT